MSRAIAESLSLLSETLDNCKTNLTEKQVADVDNIKISDVDEKIAEIQAGGGKVKSFTTRDPDQISACTLIINENETITIKTQTENVFDGTLYLVDMSDGWAILETSIKLNNYEQQFENLNIDNLINAQKAGLLIHASKTYDILENKKVPPYIQIAINKLGEE